MRRDINISVRITGKKYGSRDFQIRDVDINEGMRTLDSVLRNKYGVNIDDIIGAQRRRKS